MSPINCADINDKDSLIAYLSSGNRAKYLFFWGHQKRADGNIGKSCFSQWFQASFSIDKIHYPSAEHYMMAEKARLFNDDAALEKILASNHPADAKKLGRSVIGYQEQRWKQNRFDIVVRGNLAKFSQNEKLMQFLLNSGDRVLVEASPQDLIWGIGLTEDDPDAENPLNWRGLNLLGFALMVVREKLRTSSNPK